MKPAVFLFVMLAVAACSPKSPPPEPVSTSAAPLADSWPGKYVGDVTVKIDAAHKVMLIEGQADGCTGDIGLADGGVATKAISADELELSLRPEGVAACVIRIRKAGDVLSVTQSDTCAAYHGATCSFNGTAKRLKP